MHRERINSLNPSDKLPIDLPIGQIAALCRQYHVRELAVFGSALRPEFRDDSDLDLLVEFEPEANIGLLDYAALQIRLSDLVRRKVDLVSKGGLKPLIRGEVLNTARVIYAH